MKHRRIFLFTVLLALASTGCVTIVRHSFVGLGPPGDLQPNLTLTAGQFYKSNDATWHYKTTSSARYPETTDWPFAFGVSCTASDFELVDFSVRDDAGGILPFVKLAPAIDDYPAAGSHDSLVILAPEESITKRRKIILTTGVFHIDATYRTAGALHRATWAVTHRTKTDIEAWEMPRS